METFPIINEICKKLFEPESRRLARIIDILHKNNVEITKKLQDGFMFQGKFYKPKNAATGGGLRATLDYSLWPRMYDYLKSANSARLDQDLIKQLLYRQLRGPCASNNFQQVRDVIPDCIADLAPQNISSLSRCGDVYSGQYHIDDRKQFDEILPKIEFYSATRLLY